MTDTDDPLREVCAQLAGRLPQLARLTPEPDATAFAAPGVTARPAAAPLPGNAEALFALTGIWASARRAEALLLYAAGLRLRFSRGGSDGNTVLLLSKVIPRLAAGADNDAYRLVITDLERRLNDVLSVAAIDEVQRWRPLGKGRRCPACKCYQLHAALDARGQPTGHIECFTWGCRDANGYRPAARICADGLAWADGTVEPATEEAG